MAESLALWGVSVLTIGLMPHQDKAEAIEAASALLDLLRQKDVAVRLDEETAARLGRPELGVPAGEFAPGLDFVISLGGDGALLRAARRVYPWRIPLFGVNFGHLGFLAEVEAGQLSGVVDRLLGGDYWLEERLMVKASCGREPGCEVVGLNDVVISKGNVARPIMLEIVLNGVAITQYSTDGLIVATPTGSTAYTLSAGGPILHPNLSALVLTPVCAHSLHARPLVVDAGHAIAARLVSPPGEVMLIADGQEALHLLPGDTVSFGRAEAGTRLVRFHQQGFYDILRQRFQQGKI